MKLLKKLKPNWVKKSIYLPMAVKWNGANCLDPDLPITVGIDGGYIHSCSPKKKAKEWFEVIVGKSITDAGDTKCFGGVDQL